MIVANDATVKGGTYFPETVKKHLRAQEIALENRLPCVYLVDSGGAYLPLQADVFPDRDHFGRIFYNQARMSAAGDPAGRARDGLVHRGRGVHPGDERRDRDRAGNRHDLPRRAAAGAGRDRRGRERGGPRRVRRSTPGSAASRTTRPRDDEHALAIARSIVRHLGAQDAGPALGAPRARAAGGDARGRRRGRVPVRLRVRGPAPVAWTCARSSPGSSTASELHEFKPDYGETLVCGFAHLDGWPVGILANDGILFGTSALKGAHFIELAAQRRIPLVFLQNITGFMVGREAEASGIAKDGAKLVTAVATAEVPKLTVLIGGSFGAGNYAMAGRAYSPRFLWSWPNARISVMGGRQAARVLSTVRASSLPGGAWPSDAERDAFEAPILERYEAEGNPYHATARLWDDGILDPLETRRVLSMGIEAAVQAPIPETRFGVFRM